MPQTVLGIDLGSYSVKISQVERGFGEFRLVNFFEVPLVAEEVLTYEEASAAALTKFLEENPLIYDSCVVSIPGTMASFRTMEMPFGNVKKIDQTIEFELETVIPFEVEDVLFDYAILASTPQFSKVLSAYVRKKDFERILSHVQGAGIDPRYMGADTLDLSQLTLLGILPPEGKYALLDLGHSKSNFLVLEGNKIKTARCFSWGGHNLTQAIATALNFSYDQAETFKHQKGQLTPGSEDPAFKAILAQFEDLMQQIKQTLFAFYESGEPAIEALYLFGGTSRLQGVETFFSNRLNINVSQLDVLDDAYTALHEREKSRPIAPSSFAQALRAVFPNKGIKINFRRGDYAYKKDIEQLGGAIKKIGFLAASVAALGLIYFIVSYMNLSSYVGKLNKNVSNLVKSAVPNIPKEGLKSSSAGVNLLQGKITDMEEKLKKVQGANSLGALQVLKLVSTNLPPRDQLVLDIDDVNITEDRVRLEGRTVSYEGVDKVKTAMQKVPNFKNVETGNVRKGVRDEIKFSLSFDISG